LSNVIEAPWLFLTTASIASQLNWPRPFLLLTTATDISNIMCLTSTAARELSRLLGSLMASAITGCFRKIGSGFSDLYHRHWILPRIWQGSNRFLRPQLPARGAPIMAKSKDFGRKMQLSLRCLTNSPRLPPDHSYTAIRQTNVPSMWYAQRRHPHPHMHTDECAGCVTPLRATDPWPWLIRGPGPHLLNPLGYYLFTVGQATYLQPPFMIGSTP